MPRPFVLAADEVVNVDPPLVTPAGLTVEPLHIVAPSVPVPTLVDGRPS